MSQEIKIDGIAIAPDVLTTIVVRSLADIEGVASVGNNDLAANLVSMFSSKTSSPSLPAVCRKFERLNREYGLKQYVVPYLISSHPGSTMKEAVELAEAVRVAVSKAIDAQVGVAVCAVDVCIDNLVFPKE